MEHHIAQQCVCPCLRAALGVDGAGDVTQVCYSCLRLQIKQSALVYWTLVVVAYTNIIIAVDVAWLVCPYASLCVVGIAHFQTVAFVKTVEEIERRCCLAVVAVKFVEE